MVLSACVVALLVALAVPSCQGQGQDITVVGGASGTEVVDAVVNRIRSRCIFSEDRLFLSRVAYVMSQNGMDDSTYRTGFNGGIWQLNETMFNETTDCDNVYLQEACSKISSELGIDWSSVTWSDLRKPMYSGLAASLYTLLTLGSDSMPWSVDGQADVWAQMYDGDRDTFINEAANATLVVCTDKLDLLFILDSSASLNDSDFSLVTSFAADVVDVMDVSPDGVRVADIVYASDVRLQFDFDAYTTKEEVRNALRSSQKINSGTRTDLALTQATDLLYDYAGSGARENVKKVAVLVTDGKSEDPVATAVAAQALKDLGTTVFVIGVSNYDLTELQAIASYPSCSTVYTLTSFDYIESILTEIQKSTCEATPTLTEGTLIGTFFGNDTQTVTTRVPEHNQTIEASVTCGILGIYVSTTDLRPGPEIYDRLYQAKPTVPAILNITDTLPEGTVLFITLIGTKLSDSAATVLNCTDYRWKLEVVNKTMSGGVTESYLCEDGDVDCSVLDFERNICTDPVDAARLCPRYCGICQVPTELPATELPPHCLDFDRQCYALIDSEYCEEDIARKLCAQSCGLCGPLPEVTEAEVMNVTMAVPETTSGSFIIDPNCQDIDPDCITKLQVHYCDEEEIVRKLCRRSCGLCPIIQYPPEETTETAPVECRDLDPQCNELVETFFCETNELIRSLCPKSCDSCPLGPTQPPETCVDLDVKCPNLTSFCDRPDLLISRLCRQTCDTCNVTFGPLPNETAVTVPVTTAECIDKDPQCDQLVETFFCGTNELIRSLCTLSCDACGYTGTEVVSTSPSNACTDSNPRCPSLANLCGRPDLLINQLCPLTCDTCGVNITIPPPTDPLPLTCRVCVDPFCEHDVESVVRCPEERPYCSTRIVNNMDGTHGVTKSCISKDACGSIWYAGLAAGNDNQCSNYDPNEYIREEFICSYCCVENECNRHARPDPDTLYKGV